MEKHRYVEMTYDTPSEVTRFMAVLVESKSPAEAVKDAEEHVRRHHPDATNIEEFMQRTVSPEKAEKILKSFNNKTWEGWPL